MSWISITEADVKAALNADELRDYRARVDADQDDPIATIIADVTAEVRGYIVTRYTLAASGIPHGLKNAALDIIVYRVCKRCHTASENQRKPANDDAVALLQRVADGTHGVEDATDSTIAAASPSPSFTERTRTFDRDSQTGL